MTLMSRAVGLAGGHGGWGGEGLNFRFFQQFGESQLGVFSRTELLKGCQGGLPDGG